MQLGGFKKKTNTNFSDHLMKIRTNEGYFFELSIIIMTNAKLK